MVTLMLQDTPTIFKHFIKRWENT